MIETFVSNAVKNICERLKAFREIRLYHNELHLFFDKDNEFIEEI